MDKWSDEAKSAIRLAVKGHKMEVVRDIIAPKYGYTVRIVSVDGKCCIVTYDYHIDRLNLFIEEGYVTKVTIG
tara:strand:- start:3066 stop:3284 length:219 start_codon:yes stop_codon:yes gene_type:complete